MLSAPATSKSVSFRVVSEEQYPEELIFSVGDDDQPNKQLVSVEVYADAKERKLYARQLLYFTDLVERGTKSGVAVQHSVPVPLTEDGLQFADSLSIELSMVYRPHGASASPIPRRMAEANSSGSSRSGSRPISRADSRDRLRVSRDTESPRPGGRAESPMPSEGGLRVSNSSLYRTASGSSAASGPEPPRSLSSSLDHPAPAAAQPSGPSNQTLEPPKALYRPGSWHAGTSPALRSFPAAAPLPPAKTRLAARAVSAVPEEVSAWDALKHFLFACHPLGCRERPLATAKADAGKALPARPSDVPHSFFCFR